MAARSTNESPPAAVSEGRLNLPLPIAMSTMTTTSRIPSTMNSSMECSCTVHFSCLVSSHLADLGLTNYRFGDAFTYGVPVRREIDFVAWFSFTTAAAFFREVFSQKPALAKSSSSAIAAVSHPRICS